LPLKFKRSDTLGVEVIATCLMETRKEGAKRIFLTCASLYVA
jgi:hypothetical protein